MGQLKRMLIPGLLLLAAYYALFGGEHSAIEVWQARREVEAQQAELAALQRQIDSLRALADSLENDPATLERIAREDFGMIREGETLYRFVMPLDSVPEADSAESGPR